MPVPPRAQVLRALAEGEVDAGFVSGIMWTRAVNAGDVNTGANDALELIPGVIPPFDHCQFDALPSLSDAKRTAFSDALFAMRMDDENEARVMQQEGIQKQWERPREEGYDAMRAALADEPAVPFPGALFSTNKHPFASLTVKEKEGFPASIMVRSCAAVP